METIRPVRTASCNARMSITELYGRRRAEAGAQLVDCDIELKRAKDIKFNAVTVTAYREDTKTHLITLINGANEEVDLNSALNDWRYLGLVGKKIEMKWPLDGEFYPARVADYRKSTRKHLLCYVTEDGVTTEELNLHDTRRTWRIAENQQEVHPLIGKRIILEADVIESEDEVHRNTACVLAFRIDDILPCRGACCKRQYSTFSRTYFTIIYVSDDFLTTVRLADYIFVLENDFLAQEN